MMHYEKFISIVCGTLLMASVVYAESNSTTITADHILGLDEDTLFLNRPIDISWSADGRAFVLNSGNNTISVLSPTWQYLKTFAGRGEAPGELSNPSMLQVIADEVWVKVPRGVEIFDLDGHYQGLKRLPVVVSSVYPCADSFIGTSSRKSGIGVRLDAEGKILDYFGPRPSMEGDTKGFARSLSWLLLPSCPESCALLDRFDGQVWQISGLTGMGQPFDLELGKGKVTGGFHYKVVVSDACADPRGGYFVIHYPKAGGPGFLYHFNSDWQQDNLWRFADDMRPGLVRISPRGDICLIEETGSIIDLCTQPETK